MVIVLLVYLNALADPCVQCSFVSPLCNGSVNFAHCHDLLLAASVGSTAKIKKQEKCMSVALCSHRMAKLAWGFDWGTMKSVSCTKVGVKGKNNSNTGVVESSYPAGKIY